MIKYHLKENLLTERADDYSAQVLTAGTCDKDALVERMLQRGSLLTKTDILAVLNSVEETVVDLIKEGNTVAIPLFQTGFSISGVFEGAMDMFDPARHKLNITINKGTLLRDAQAQVKLEKTSATASTFAITEVRDTVSGTVNTTLTPSGIMEIYGSNIKVTGDNPDCGIYLVSADGSENKVSVIAQNTPSTLMCLLPALAAGTYQVKVVTQFGTGGATQLKTPRTTQFERDLVVA